MRVFALSFLILAFASGCDQVAGTLDSGSWPTIDGSSGPCEFCDAPAPEACANMDILFVVDDSDSMVDEQASLASNFPLFYDVLDTYQTGDGGLLDYRIAITTTGVTASPIASIPGVGDFPLPQAGADGAFRQECGMTKKWLERADADVSSTFACAAQVGTDGPAFEMQLAASKLALSREDNGQFLRDDALLAIVILTDEDDCSVEDNQEFVVPNDSCKPAPPEMLGVDHYIEFFDELKSGRERWAAAVIAGDASCPDSYADAVRLREFVTEAGDNVIHRPICVGSLADALQAAIDKFDAACQAMPEVE